jgi:hypothetical protein
VVSSLDRAIADTTALLAFTGALPFEPPPPTDTLLALDASLVDLIDVLCAFHEGRRADVFGDLACIGPMVDRWLPANQLATAVTELLLAHPTEAATDLAALAAAQTLDMPLLTVQSHLADLAPDADVVVLPRRQP